MTNLSDLFPPYAIDSYTPAMMLYSSAGYYSKIYTATGNKISIVMRFKSPGFTTAARYLGAARIATDRFTTLLVHSDHADLAGLLNFNTLSAAGAFVCRLWSESRMDDGELHIVHYEYDGDAGTAAMIIDGIAHDAMVAARVAPVAATLSTGAGTLFVGSANIGVTPLLGEIGYMGMGDVSGLSWQDFMDSNGNPKVLDESGWTEWGAQPLFWNEHGDMINNLGSAGNMAKNGTIVVGKGGN